MRVPSPKYIKDDNKGEYALKTAMKVIDGFSEYFAFDYTNSFEAGRAKSDQIGIPDFTALGDEQGKQGKENWGLITYQYDRVYFDPENSYEEYVTSGSEFSIFLKLVFES